MIFKLENISSLVCLIFVSQKLNVVHASTNTTFSISLQSSKELTLEDYARYQGTIPRLDEFTACQWDKIKYFSSNIAV